MTIFAVLLPQPTPALAEAIRREFPTEHLLINETQWLVSFTGTAVELCARLGIYDAKNPSATTGNALVLATSSYFGRGPTSIWDWMKVKLESTPRG